MNLFEVQERLKDFSKDQLVSQMQNPTGTAPPYLILSELQRRTRMEQAMQADGQQAPQTTVADDTVAAAGLPQGGLGDMARALAPQTDMTQNDAAAPVQQMAEGGQVSNNDQVQNAISSVMGGANAMTSMPMMEQLAPAAQRLGITAQGLSQAAARPVVPQVAQPQMPQVDTSRIDDILSRINQPPQAAAAPAAARNNWYQNPDDRVGPMMDFMRNMTPGFDPYRSDPSAAPAAPAAPTVSQSDYAYVLANAPTMEQRQMALEAMKQAQAQASAPQPIRRSTFTDANRKAEGGVVRMQEGGDIPSEVMSDPALIVMANRAGMSVQQYLDELSPEARAQLIRNIEQRGSFDLAGDDAAFSRFSDISRGEDMLPGQDYLDNRPMRDALRQTSSDLGIAGIPSRLSPPASRMMILPEVSQPDTDARAAGVAAYPSGRGNTAPYPSQPSLLGGMPEFQNSEPVPEGLGIEGVINPEAAVLGSGEMAAGHPLPDRLLDIPGINTSMDRGPQYVGAMRNLIGLSDEGLPAQLAAEDAVMGMPVPAAPISTYRDPNIDTTDDARAARGFGRSAYLDGLASPADSPSLLGTILSGAEANAASEPETPMAMSAGEVGAPRPSLVPDFVTDTETEMDRLARESAEEAAELRDDAGIEESLRTDEDKAAAAAAARESLVGGTRTAPPGGGGGSATVSASSSEASAEGGGDNADKWLALARFGLGLMQSQQPTFGGAIGEAGMGALDELRAIEDRDYERNLAEREFALKQQIAAARSAGRGGSGGASAYELGLDVNSARALEELRARKTRYQMELSQLDTGGMFSNADARIRPLQDAISSIDKRIDDIVNYSVGGPPEPPGFLNGSPYSITDVR